MKYSEIQNIYIECGTTFNNNYNTGIQRVVRNIINNIPNVIEKYNFNIIPVIFQNNHFELMSESKTCDVSMHITSRKVLLKMLIKRMLPARVSQLLKSLINRNIVHSKNTELKITCESSVLLLLDSTWNMGIFKHLDNLRADGLKVFAVLYDLIPFQHPETVESTTYYCHTSWWKEAPEHLDGIIAISNTVRKEYLDWQRSFLKKQFMSDDNVDYFYLGADLKQGDPFMKLMSSSSVLFIVVGSLEPRKNHKTILDAFDILWASGVDVDLAIVGGYGWKSADIINRINTHPMLNKKLYYITDATDRDLNILYQKASALIIASIAEGFGLPIVEAFQHGIRVICSDIPVFQEVAGDCALYFAPDDSKALSERVLDVANYSVSNVLTKNEVNFKWQTWEDSTNELIQKIIGLYVRRS